MSLFEELWGKTLIQLLDILRLWIWLFRPRFRASEWQKENPTIPQRAKNISSLFTICSSSRFTGITRPGVPSAAWKIVAAVTNGQLTLHPIFIKVCPFVSITTRVRLAELKTYPFLSFPLAKAKGGERCYFFRLAVIGIVTKFSDRCHNTRLVERFNNQVGISPFHFTCVLLPSAKEGSAKLALLQRRECEASLVSKKGVRGESC